MHESASSLLRIIDDILDFSKIEAERIGIEREPLAPATLVEGVAEALAAQAQRKKLQFTTSVDDTVPAFVEADPVRLRQILFNLVGNAIKFIERGEVSVHVSASPAPSGDLMLRVDVRDTGIGIAPDVLEQLFQPFVQADGSITRRFGGTGLGLSISKRLAELMGGEIGVDSMPGRGSTFWFTAAVRSSAMAVEDLTDASTPPDAIDIAPPDRETALAAGELILVAEDNATNRMVLARQLAQLGYVADVVDNGRQALARFQETPYGLVFTDIHMPGMDGLALTAAIRDLDRRDGRRHVPVLALTADVLIGESERYRAAGIDDRIHKPASLSDIQAALDRWLPHAGRHPAVAALPEPGGRATAAEVLNLEQMRQNFGSLNATAVILLRRYVEDTTPLIADIERAWAGRHVEDLHEATHSALGASRTAGAEQLSAILSELQAAIKAGTWDETDALQAQLTAAFGRVKDAVDRLAPVS